MIGGVSLPAGGKVEFLCWSDGVDVWVPYGSHPAMQAIQVTSLNAG